MMPRAADIEAAVGLLQAGELVAFPTETVYGLGADARNPAAVARIFAAKGRPRSHPLIVHLSGTAVLPRWAREVPAPAQRLAEAFWPGPLTLVLPRHADVPDAVTGGQDSVGLRAPAHPVARALLAAFGNGIAAPSANRYGRISPTSADDVREELGDRVAMVLDGGECPVGLESTIVGCLDGQVILLRPGSITRSQLEDVAGEVSLPGRAAPRTSGGDRSHYAPATPLQLLAAADIAAETRRASAGGEQVAVLARTLASAPPGVMLRQLGPEPAAYGRGLYRALRELDRLGVQRILVEAVPEDEAWAAITDRLGRAAAGSVASGGEAT